jgi:hypothetical protein
VSIMFCNYVGITILTTCSTYRSTNLHVLNSCGASLSDVRKADACFLSDQYKTSSCYGQWFIFKDTIPQFSFE